MAPFQLSKIVCVCVCEKEKARGNVKLRESLFFLFFFKKFSDADSRFYFQYFVYFVLYLF